MIKLIQPSIVSSVVIGFLFTKLMTDKDYESIYVYFFLFVFLTSLPINILFQLFLVHLKTNTVYFSTSVSPQLLGHLQPSQLRNYFSIYL